MSAVITAAKQGRKDRKISRISLFEPFRAFRLRSPSIPSVIHFAFLLTPQTPVRLDHAHPVDHPIPLTTHEDDHCFRCPRNRLLRAICLAGDRRGDAAGDRVVVVRGHAFLHDDGHQPADFGEHSVAAARSRLGKGVPAIRDDRRGDRCADAGTGRRSDPCAGAAAVAAEGPVSLDRAAEGRQRSLRRTACCSRRPSRLGAADEGADPGAAPDPGAGRRPVSLRGVIQALQFGLLGVQGGQHHARQHDLADDARRQHDREGQCRAAGELFLA